MINYITNLWDDFIEFVWGSKEETITVLAEKPIKINKHLEKDSAGRYINAGSLTFPLELFKNNQ